jgi:hypothetical protein
MRSAWQFLTRWATQDVEATRVLRLISQPGVRKQLSDEVAEAVARGVAQVRGHLSALVEEGMNANLYHGHSPDEGADLVWSLLLGILQANDARQNVDLQGGNFENLSRAAFTAIDTTLRHPATEVALRAA